MLLIYPEWNLMLVLMVEGVNFADHLADGGWPNQVSVYIYNIYILLSLSQHSSITRIEEAVPLFLMMALAGII